MEQNDSFTILRDALTECARNAVEAHVPDGVAYIESGAFALCADLASVDLGPDVRAVGSAAFNQCASLRQLTMPSCLSFIGERAFCGCTALSDLRYGGTREQWRTVYAHKDWASDIPADAVHCSDGDEPLTRAEKAMHPALSAQPAPRAEDAAPLAIAGREVTGCAQDAADVRVPDGVTYIDGFAFALCGSLRSVDLGPDARAVDGAAFHLCSALEAVTLPAGVVFVGSGAFTDCTALSDLRYGGTREQWRAMYRRPDWISGDTRLTSVHCADGDEPLAWEMRDGRRFERR